MEPNSRIDLVLELNAMQKKMGSTLDYWDGVRNCTTIPAVEAAVVDEPTQKKGPRSARN